MPSRPPMIVDNVFQTWTSIEAVCTKAPVQIQAGANEQWHSFAGPEKQECLIECKCDHSSLSYRNIMTSW
jgi:hypothetical protein